MERPPRRPRRLRRGAYLLPSLFTIGNILLGFYAVVRGLDGDLRLAAWLVVAAAVLDGLDGGLARLTGVETDFGREFDSLADVLTFGATPALLSYLLLADGELGRLRWLIPLFYLVCTATRLARFNVQTHWADRRYFVGLPAPAAAGSVAALLIFLPDGPLESIGKPPVLILLAGLGLLMVSTFRYRSFKQLGLRRPRTYRTALPLAALLLLIAFRPEVSLLAAAIGYTLSGPVVWAVGRLRRAVAQHRQPAADEQ